MFRTAYSSSSSCQDWGEDMMYVNTYNQMTKGMCHGCDTTVREQSFTNIESGIRGDGRVSFTLWFCGDCMDKVLREYTLSKVRGK